MTHPMCKRLFCSGVLATSLLGASQAMARDGFVAELGAFYFQDESGYRQDDSNGREHNNTQTNTYTFINAQGLYQMNYLVFGLKYLTGTIDATYKSSTSSSKTTTTENYKGLGLSVGARGEAAIITYSYFLNPEKVYGAKLTSDFGDGDSDKTIYYGSYAHAIDLGYGFNISGVMAGPMVSFLQFDFNKYKTSGGSKTTLNPKVSDSFIMPQLALWFDF